MSEVHRIRLLGPWVVAALARAAGGALPAGTRMTMPTCWRDGGWPGFAGTARHTRRFGLPSNVAETQSVWLTFSHIEGAAIVRLNGQPVASRPGAGAVAVEVTCRLQTRNVLEVDVESDTDGGGLCGEIALEIRPAQADQPSR